MTVVLGSRPRLAYIAPLAHENWEHSVHLRVSCDHPQVPLLHKRAQTAKREEAGMKSPTLSTDLSVKIAFITDGSRWLQRGGSDVPAYFCSLPSHVGKNYYLVS